MTGKDSDVSPLRMTHCDLSDRKSWTQEIVVHLSNRSQFLYRRFTRVLSRMAEAAASHIETSFHHWFPPSFDFFTSYKLTTRPMLCYITNMLCYITTMLCYITTMLCYITTMLNMFQTSNSLPKTNILSRMLNI